LSPVGHDHGADGTHLCESDAAVHDIRLVPSAAARTAADARIFRSPRRSARGPSTSAAMFAFSAYTQSPPDDGAQAGFESQVSDSPQAIPLSSIVLQV